MEERQFSIGKRRFFRIHGRTGSMVFFLKKFLVTSGYRAARCMVSIRIQSYASLMLTDARPQRLHDHGRRGVTERPFYRVYGYRSMQCASCAAQL